MTSFTNVLGTIMTSYTDVFDALRASHTHDNGRTSFHDVLDTQ